MIQQNTPVSAHHKRWNQENTSTESVNVVIADPRYPGYTWKSSDGKWQLQYQPVKGRYSPPILATGMQVSSITVPPDLQNQIGRVIGREGIFLKKITEISGVSYIFYRNDRKEMEIWGVNTHNIHHATSLLYYHFFVMIQV